MPRPPLAPPNRDHAHAFLGTGGYFPRRGVRPRRDRPVLQGAWAAKRNRNCAKATSARWAMGSPRAAASSKGSRTAESQSAPGVAGTGLRPQNAHASWFDWPWQAKHANGLVRTIRREVRTAVGWRMTGSSGRGAEADDMIESRTGRGIISSVRSWRAGAQLAPVACWLAETSTGGRSRPYIAIRPSDYSAASFKRFTARAFSLTLAGLAANHCSSLVKGLMPLRLGLAGTATRFTRSSPGMVN